MCSYHFPVPCLGSLTQAIRNFAKSLESWLRNSMGGCCNIMVETKVFILYLYYLIFKDGKNKKMEKRIRKF